MTTKTVLAANTVPDEAVRRAQVEDRDADRLKKREHGMYQRIEFRVTRLRYTPDAIRQWLDRQYGWEPEINIYVMCMNAAKSMYRKRQELEAAKEAESKASDAKVNQDESDNTLSGSLRDTGFGSGGIF